MSPTPPRLLALLALGLLGGGASGCGSTMQRLPGPLERPRGEPEAEPSADVQEVLVVRHSDPVLLRRPGMTAAYPMAFYRKRERLRAGGWVLCNSGGRAELVWPGAASSVVLFDDGALVLGDPARDQPLVRLREVTRARLVLTPEDRIELVGGAILQGDPSRPSGPFVVDRIGPGRIRVVNQSKLDARIGYRQEELHLRAGDAVDLPVLAGGTGPRVADPDRVELESGGLHFGILGAVTPQDEGTAVRLTAQEESEVSALGVCVALGPGEEAVFASLGQRPQNAPPPAATPAPEQ